MVSKASELLPDPDSPVITTSASRGSVREMSLRLCSRAPETTICSPAAISRAFYDPEQTFACEVGGRSRFDRRVNLVDELERVGELEVLREVALGVGARLAGERHVQRDQPRAVNVAVL